MKFEAKTFGKRPTLRVFPRIGLLKQTLKYYISMVISVARGGPLGAPWNEVEPVDLNEDRTAQELEEAVKLT